MEDLLLKFFGIDASQPTSAPPELLPASPYIETGWIVLLVVLAVFATVMAYRWAPAEVSWPRRIFLAGLRLAFFALLIGILLQPTIRFNLVDEREKTLILMTDVSQSMSLADPRVEDVDLQRAAYVMGMVKDRNATLSTIQKSNVEQVSRIDLVKAALRNEDLDLTGQLDEKFDLAPYTFGESTEDQNPGDDNETSQEYNRWVERLAATSPATAIGAAMDRAVNERRDPDGGSVKGLSDRVAGIFLMTDGGNNRGPTPESLMERLKSVGDGVPVYIYGVGLTKPRDANILGFTASSSVFKGDKVAAFARLKTEGLAGQELDVKLYIRPMGSNEEFEEVSRVLSEGEGELLAIAQDGIQERPVLFNFDADTAGNFELEVRVTSPSDQGNPAANSLKEADVSNNVKRLALEVIDPENRPIRVLLVDEAPRWEFQYLMAMLGRDSQVKLDVLLFEGAKTIVKNDSLNPDSPYIGQFPDEEAIRDYDVVILGDINPAALQRAAGSAPNQPTARSNKQIVDGLHNFVALYGGRLVVMAGKRHFPAAYVSSGIEPMLPVVLNDDAAQPVGTEAYGQTEIRLVRTSDGQVDNMLRLADDEASNRVLWGEAPPRPGASSGGGDVLEQVKPLPSIFWVADVEKIKPTAQALLVVDDESKAERFKQRPVLALHRYGAGEVMYMGTDNLWRWRKNSGEEHHKRFWTQLVQRMALPRLSEFDRDFRLTVNRAYRAGEPVRVTADLFGEERPQEINAVYTDASGNEKAITLRLSGEDSRTYEGDFLPPTTGNYAIHLVEHPGKPRYFSVVDTNIEMKDTAMREAELRELAGRTGGMFAREFELKELRDRIISDAGTRNVNAPEDHALWSTIPYFLLLLLVITAEWVIRKLSYLK